MSGERWLRLAGRLPRWRQASRDAHA
jgi:hypothetical protein